MKYLKCAIKKRYFKFMSFAIFVLFFSHVFKIVQPNHVLTKKIKQLFKDPFFPIIFLKKLFLLKET